MRIMPPAAAFNARHTCHLWICRHLCLMAHHASLHVLPSGQPSRQCVVCCRGDSKEGPAAVAMDVQRRPVDQICRGHSCSARWLLCILHVSFSLMADKLPRGLRSAGPRTSSCKVQHACFMWAGGRSCQPTSALGCPNEVLQHCKSLLAQAEQGSDFVVGVLSLHLAALTQKHSPFYACATDVACSAHWHLQPHSSTQSCGMFTLRQAQPCTPVPTRKSTIFGLMLTTPAAHR